MDRYSHAFSDMYAYIWRAYVPQGRLSIPILLLRLKLRGGNEVREGQGKGGEEREKDG
jgi:hypothetical protein